MTLMPQNIQLDYDKLPVMDKWLLSKLNTLVKTVDEDLDDYKIPEDSKSAAGLCG